MVMRVEGANQRIDKDRVGSLLPDWLQIHG